MGAFHERLAQLLEPTSSALANVARAAGIEEFEVSLWGDGGDPTPDQVAAICRTLDVSADWLLGLTDTDEARGSASALSDDEATKLIDHVLWLVTEQLLKAVRENEEMSPAGKRRFMMAINDFDLGELSGLDEANRE